MSETTTATKGEPQATARTSKGKDGTTSTVTPESFTKEQVKKFVSDALAEQGRKHKAELDPIVKERDSFKSQCETNTRDLNDNKVEMEKQQAKIDDLASDDPARFDAIKELKAVREERKQLQAKERVFETEKQTHGERIKKAEELEREVLILEIVEDYEGATPDKLTDICTTLNIKSDEQIRKVADTLWSKKTTESSESEVPSVKPFSNKTTGGTSSLADLPPSMRAREVDRILRTK